MVARVGGKFLLPTNSYGSQQLAANEVPLSLAGMNRYLYELYAGESGVDGEDPVTPANPQGEVGLDMSGPPWGSAFVQSLAHAGGRDADADIQHPRGSMFGASIPAGASRSFSWVFNHQQFEVLPSPYVAPLSVLTPTIYSGRETSGTTSVTIDAFVDGAQQGTATFSVTSTGERDFSGVLLTVKPGINLLSFIFTVNSGNNWRPYSMTLRAFSKRDAG